MPVTRPHGFYVNPFSMLCDRCEDRVSSYWSEDRCQYLCDACEKDVTFEEEMARECAEYDLEAAE